MPKFEVDLPARAVAALSDKFGYPAKVPDPSDETVNEMGMPTPALIKNPVPPLDYIKQRVIDWLLGLVAEAEGAAAGQAQREKVRAEVKIK